MEVTAGGLEIQVWVRVWMWVWVRCHMWRKQYLLLGINTSMMMVTKSIRVKLTQCMEEDRIIIAVTVVMNVIAAVIAAKLNSAGSRYRLYRE